MTLALRYLQLTIITMFLRRITFSKRLEITMPGKVDQLNPQQETVTRVNLPPYHLRTSSQEGTLSTTTSTLSITSCKSTQRSRSRGVVVQREEINNMARININITISSSSMSSTKGLFTKWQVSLGSNHKM